MNCQDYKSRGEFMKTAKDFRAIARENLHGNWTNAILTVLVFESNTVD